MPRSLPNLACCLLALGLAALAPAPGTAGEARGPLVVAQADEADDDGEDVPPRRRGTGEDSDQPDDAGPMSVPAAGGGVAAIDIIDAANEDPQGVAANQPQDTVVCLAGCEGPRGVVVYNKPRP